MNKPEKEILLRKLSDFSILFSLQVVFVVLHVSSWYDMPLPHNNLTMESSLYLTYNVLRTTKLGYGKKTNINIYG